MPEKPPVYMLIDFKNSLNNSKNILQRITSSCFKKVDKKALLVFCLNRLKLRGKYAFDCFVIIYLKLVKIFYPLCHADRMLIRTLTFPFLHIFSRIFCACLCLHDFSFREERKCRQGLEHQMH